MTRIIKTTTQWKRGAPKQGAPLFLFPAAVRTPLSHFSAPSALILEKEKAECSIFNVQSSIDTKMFRLDNLLEEWATIYGPLKHDMAEKSTYRTFFRISMIDAQSYFVRNFPTQPSPCMAYATHVDAEIERNTKFINYRHVIYFLEKQVNVPQKNDVTDEMAATDARYDTDDLVQDLLVFLDRLQTAANNGKSELTVAGHSFPITSDIRQGLRGLKLSEAHWGTLPAMFNGWQICGLTIDQAAPRLLCINEEKYI
jgi:hypothetical protein